MCVLKSTISALQVHTASRSGSWNLIPEQGANAGRSYTWEKNLRTFSFACPQFYGETECRNALRLAEAHQ